MQQVLKPPYQPFWWRFLLPADDRPPPKVGGTAGGRISGAYIAGMPEALPRAAQPEYLTDALRRAGALGAGGVCDVVVEGSKATILSRSVRLRLSYDGAAQETPAALILKTGLPDRAGTRWNWGRKEVAFYTQIATAMSARLVPRCFDAVWREDTNDWHLLLEDLTDTHFTLAL